MRVLITGGTGLIGRSLVEALIKAGYEPIVLSRRPDSVHDLPAAARVVGWNAESAAGWGHLVDGAKAIINLAGENISGSGFIPARWTASRKQSILASRLAAGRAVMEAVSDAEVRPEVVIQSSAVGYYGSSSAHTLDESAPSGDGFLADVAVQWEASTAAVKDLGVRHVIARTGVVMSGEDGALPRMLFPYRLFVGGPLGSGRQMYSWIHIDDVVRGLIWLMENNSLTGPFNLTAPNPVSNADLGRTIGRVLHRPHWVPVPSFALKAALGEVASVVLEGQQARPRKLLDSGFDFHFPTAETALRDLLK